MLDAPPEVPTRAAAVNTSPALPRGFVAPPSRPMERGVPAVGTEAPALNAVPTPAAETTMAIVGLNPANTREVPRPPASRAAGFSSGLVEQPDGHALERLGRRAHLGQHIDAVGVLLDHPLQPPHLALDAAQAVGQPLLVVVAALRGRCIGRHDWEYTPPGYSQAAAHVGG